MLFKPLDDNLINDFLSSQYVYKLPQEYIEFLKYTNGANLCNVKVWHTINKKKIPTSASLLVIYGLPRTQPFGRPSDMEEPFDLRIEDLRRHNNTPRTWLHCGNYFRDYDIHTDFDIFIDSENGNVYSCIRNTNEISDSWKNLDDCFCNIYHSFADMKYEYEYNSYSK